MFLFTIIQYNISLSFFILHCSSFYFFDGSWRRAVLATGLIDEMQVYARDSVKFFLSRRATNFETNMRETPAEYKRHGRLKTSDQI